MAPERLRGVPLRTRFGQHNGRRLVDDEIDEIKQNLAL